MSIITQTLKTLTDGKHLTEHKARELFDHIFAHDIGDNEKIQLGAILASIQTRIVTPDEIAGFSSSMINNAIKVDYHQNTLDTCGTGGDNSHSINISTASALTLSSMGVKVAKHGNRSASSKCGSADILERLGISIDNKAEAAVEQLDKSNFTFLFARSYHPAMAKLGPVRTAMGIRTVFNILGPITNPTNPKSQVIGVYDNKYAKLIAQTLQNRGSKGYIVHSVSGLDEASIFDDTYVTAFDDTTISEYIIKPEDFGISDRKLKDIQAGETIEANYDAIVKLFKGEGDPAHTEAVSLNAALGKSAYDGSIAHNGNIEGLKKNYEQIRTHIESGKVAEFVFDKFGVVFK